MRCNIVRLPTITGIYVNSHKTGSLTHGYSPHAVLVKNEIDLDKHAMFIPLHESYDKRHAMHAEAMKFNYYF